MSSQENALVQMEESFASLSISREPTQVLEEAKKAALAIKNVIDQKKNKVVFNGETYMENEDWITLARFYGVTARVLSTNYVEFGPVRGFEAVAEAYLVSTGQVIGKAEAMCLNDEENWGLRPKYEWVDELDAEGKKIWLKNSATGKMYTKGSKKQVGSVQVPLFQLRSMAQTRATSKVLSLLFKWVVVLSGIKPTPAEEIDSTTIDAAIDAAIEQNHRESGTEPIKRPARKQQAEAAQKTEPTKEPDKPRDPDCITEPQNKMLYAISKMVKLSDDELKSEITRLQLKTKTGEPVLHTRDIQKKDFQALIDGIDPDKKYHQSVQY